MECSRMFGGLRLSERKGVWEASFYVEQKKRRGDDGHVVVVRSFGGEIKWCRRTQEVEDSSSDGGTYIVYVEVYTDVIILCEFEVFWKLSVWLEIVKIIDEVIRFLLLMLCIVICIWWVGIDCLTFMLKRQWTFGSINYYCADYYCS